eukprot:bmy_19404T0
MSGVLGGQEISAACGSTAAGQSGNWGSELGGDARPSRDQSLCLPKSLSSWSFFPVQTPSSYCPLVEGKNRRKCLGASRRERSRPSWTWKKPAKSLRSSHRARPRRMRSGLLWNTLPKSRLRRSRLRRSNPRRRSSFLRNSFLSSFPRCSCPRSALLRNACLGRTFLRSALPWSSLLAEWANIN